MPNSTSEALKQIQGMVFAQLKEGERPTLPPTFIEGQRQAGFCLRPREEDLLIWHEKSFLDAKNSFIDELQAYYKKRNYSKDPLQIIKAAFTKALINVLSDPQTYKVASYRQAKIYALENLLKLLEQDQSTKEGRHFKAQTQYIDKQYAHYANLLTVAYLIKGLFNDPSSKVYQYIQSCLSNKPTTSLITATAEVVSALEPSQVKYPDQHATNLLQALALEELNAKLHTTQLNRAFTFSGLYDIAEKTVMDTPRRRLSVLEYLVFKGNVSALKAICTKHEKILYNIANQIRINPFAEGRQYANSLWENLEEKGRERARINDINQARAVASATPSPDHLTNEGTSGVSSNPTTEQHSSQQSTPRKRKVKFALPMFNGSSDSLSSCDSALQQGEASSSSNANLSPEQQEEAHELGWITHENPLCV